MSPIDLDRVEEMAWTYPPEGWDREYVFSLIAELRAAREALRLAPRPPNFNTPTAAYVAALAAYDQAVAP